MVLACTVEVRHTAVACSLHWAFVPKDLKLRLWSLYEDGLRSGTKPWDEAVALAASAAAGAEFLAQGKVPAKVG